MSTDNPYLMQVIGCIRFDTAGALVGDLQRGATVVRNGAGDYTVTLDDGGVDADRGQILVTPETADIKATIVHTSDTAKQILTTNNAGAATDAQCTVSVLKLLGSAGR